jgi:hypothetical protein
MVCCGLILDIRALCTVTIQRPVWSMEEQSRETSRVEACAEELGRCTTGREKELLWMKSGRKVCRRWKWRSVRRIRNDVGDVGEQLWNCGS